MVICHTLLPVKTQAIHWKLLLPELQQPDAGTSCLSLLHASVLLPVEYLPHLQLSVHGPVFQNAKDHGVTQKEIAAIITHIAFYAGWPKGWAVFNLAKEVWNEEEIEK